MPIEVDDDSRFVATPIVIVDGIETFGRWKPPEFLSRELDENTEIGKLVVRSNREGRTDLISNDIYGTPRLQWVLIMFNKPRNPLGWPKTNEVIRYPFKSVVLSSL